MKKILIATSALVAISAPAFALDVKTSGAVEYRYNKATEKNVAKNAKLSQQDAHIKFAASGASNGLAYGAWIKTKSGTATTSSKKASGSDVYAVNESSADDQKANTRELRDAFALVNGYKAKDGETDATKNSDAKVFGIAFKDKWKGLKVPTTIASGKKITNNHVIAAWVQAGTTQDGTPIYARLTAAANDATNGLAHGRKLDGTKLDTYSVDGIQVGGSRDDLGKVKHGTLDSSTGNTSANVEGFGANGSTSSANYKTSVRKSVTPGSSQTLANNASTQSAMWVNGAFGGLVIGQDGDATGLAPSGSVSAAGFTTGKQVASFTAGNIYGARATYTAPTFVDGLKLQYTQNFKGNVSADKSAKVKAPTSYGVQYATDFAGVMFKVGYAQADLGKQGSAKAIKNTKTGVELGYGGFTVGYGTFTVGKKAFQKSDTTGTNYGVKYASGAWAVGYTVNKSEDKNKYVFHSNKTANTNAISASYKVADGFNVYASKSSNSVKNTNGKTEKNSYTIIGAKISF